MKKKAKVISVGNIALGGAGKTPHTIEITGEYLKRGEKPVILSLGYKGKLGYGMNVISDGKSVLHKPPMAADEPYMMALNCPGAAVITGKNRGESLLYAQKNFGSTLAVLDDGFQHRALKRDADVLLLDYENPVSTGLPFPFGYIRETPSAIGRADIIVFTRASGSRIPERAKKYVAGKPVFFSRTVTDKVVFPHGTLTLEDLKGTAAGAFSAVASNNAFRNGLSSAGIKITAFRSFRDHYAPAENTLEALIKKASAGGADFFLTTEKDFIKLPEKYREIFGYVKMEIEISEKDAFFRAIDGLLGVSSGHVS